MGLTKQETLQLRSALQDAVVKCSERCLYQSAKWAAELLTSIPETPSASANPIPILLTPNVDPVEARLEAAEINKYLLAKTFFDCREYDRCAAVFLPDSLVSGVLSTYRQDHDFFHDDYLGAAKEASFSHSQSQPQSQSQPRQQTRSSSVGSNSSSRHRLSGRARSHRHSSLYQQQQQQQLQQHLEERAAPVDEQAPPPHEGEGNTANSTATAPPPAGATPIREPTLLEAEPVSTLPELSQKSLFLALYAKLISGEKKKDEEVEMLMGPHDSGEVVNRQLRVISAYLQTWFDRNTDGDEERVVSQGWLEYLYGMVLAKEKNEKEAMEWFLRSVHRFPMNWGCWQEMTALITRVDELNKVSPQLPQNIMSYIFHLHVSLELYQHSANLAHSLDELLAVFPNSSFLLTCHALLAYHSKDLLAAEQHFGALLAQHPHRLDALDHYSNILYVLNLRPKLAFLAHLCASLDKFRPETCVVIGNYYSLLSAHEKAVQYFRRALALDRSCLSAWTLMGHEYVELKNTHAAIESYRRAVDVNRRDYRAWYGLGQTYEVLELHTYALWYYRKAAGLRPWDGKMWMAVGSCLQKMGRERDGIKALKRALLADSYEGQGKHGNEKGGGGGTGRNGYLDPEVLLQIATMYDQLNDKEQAKSYMELCMAQEEGDFGGGGGGGGGTDEGDLGDSVMQQQQQQQQQAVEDGEDRMRGEGTGVTPATNKARLWLAHRALEEGEYELVHQLAGELCQDGVEVEEAKALTRAAREEMERE